MIRCSPWTTTRIPSIIWIYAYERRRPPRRLRGQKEKKMKITQTMNNEWRNPETKAYEIEGTMTIREAAEKYGKANDTVRLYENDKLVGVATWLVGANQYQYCESPDEHTSPKWWDWTL